MLWLASTLFLPCPSHLNQASVENDYQDKSRAQWGGGGRPRHSPSVLGGEGQSLGTKDIFSWGLVHIRWSHVYINLVTYMKPITNRFATRMLVVAVDIRRTQLLILEILWHTCLSRGTQQWPFQQVFFLFACISTFWRHFELRHVYLHVHTDATLLDVICFLRLQTMLHGVACC